MKENEKVIIGADAGSGRKDKYVIPFYIQFPYTDEKGNEQNITISTNDIKDEDFYNRMRKVMEENKIPKTSGVITNTEIMKSGFGEIITGKENRSVIFINTTSKHSNSFDTATKSWQDIMEENPNIKAKVIDSQQVSEGIGFQINLGKELSEKGASLEQITEEIENIIPRIVSFISLDNVLNVLKGGRLGNLTPRVSDMINSALRFRLMLQLKDGKLTPLLEFPRTVAKAWERILERAGEMSSFEKISVVHANCEEKAKGLAESLGKVFGGPIIVAKVDLAVAVHAGEGAVAFFGLKKK